MHFAIRSVENKNTRNFELNGLFPLFSKLLTIFQTKLLNWPITVAARPKACNVLARSNAWILGSNPTQGMYVCPSLFCVCVVLRK
jgi:hypothetical protein